MTSPHDPTDLSHLQEDFDDFFDNTPIGFVTASNQGRILRANQRLAGWLGLTREELVDMEITDLLSIGGKIYFETHLRPLLRMQGMFEEVAVELISKTGERFPVVANALERRDDSGRVSFIRFAFLRAGDRKKYEQNLRDERSAALQGRRTAEKDLSSERVTGGLREQFIAVLGHDLRNPLASITAGIRMLRKSIADDKAATVIALMESSTLRMAGLIDNIMDFARGRLGGGIPIDRHAVLLEPVFQHVVDELKASNAGRRIDVDMSIPEPFVCDPGRLSQVLSNLLANALSHGSPEGAIVVRARQAGGSLELSVSNQGTAIPPDVIETLFEPYTRENVRPSQQGLGLGLYISAEIARAHGGTLTATSGEHGTTFTLIVPTE